MEDIFLIKIAIHGGRKQLRIEKGFINCAGRISVRLYPSEDAAGKSVF